MFENFFRFLGYEKIQVETQTERQEIDSRLFAKSQQLKSFLASKNNLGRRLEAIREFRKSDHDLTDAAHKELETILDICRLDAYIEAEQEEMRQLEKRFRDLDPSQSAGSI